MKKSLKNCIQGFTLIEFIVVMTIFSIMSAVSVFNYNEYSDNIKTNNIAQDIAITIRQAQVYGLSGSDNTTNIARITQDRSIRGVSIDLGTDTMTIFEDNRAVRNFVYDNGDDLIIDKRTIKSQDIGIIEFELCNEAGTCVTENSGSVDISFRRPYPDAFISLDGNPDPSNPYRSVSLVIGTDQNNDSSVVTVNSVGSISVKKNI